MLFFDFNQFFMFIIYLVFYSTIFDSLYWYSDCDYTMLSLIAIYVSYSKNRPFFKPKVPRTVGGWGSAPNPAVIIQCLV